MRKLRTGVFLENRYLGVTLGAVHSGEGLLLIDSPVRSDDLREWVVQLSPHGRPRYLALLDHHPDRSLGARALEIPIVGHDKTLEEMRGWSDAFKGNAKPIGADADRLKRITGVNRAVPELAFSLEMTLQLGEREVHFVHRPGPMPGSMWVILENARIAFIGDTVSVTEPPYFGDSDLESWMVCLDELRGAEYEEYTLISSRDGMVDRDDLNAMARQLRKVEHRMDKLSKRGDPLEAAGKLAPQLMKGFKIAAARRDLVALRLRSGLTALYARLNPSAK